MFTNCTPLNVYLILLLISVLILVGTFVYIYSMLPSGGKISQVTSNSGMGESSTQSIGGCVCSILCLLLVYFTCHTMFGKVLGWIGVGFMSLSLLGVICVSFILIKAVNALKNLLDKRDAPPNPPQPKIQEKITAPSKVTVTTKQQSPTDVNKVTVTTKVISNDKPVITNNPVVTKIVTIDKS